MTLWRISIFADLKGLAGERSNGRWHTAAPDKRIVYLAEHPALALVETLVNLNDSAQELSDKYQLIKVAVPAMLQRIADRAMQVFGAMGGSDDTPIHQALAWGRLLRIGDGPDEVHLRQIFRMEDLPKWSIADSPYLAAHPA